MSSTGVSSSSTEGAVADRFVGGEMARFGGRARLAWTVNEERAAGLFITEQTSDQTRQQSLASLSWLIIIYFPQISLIIRLRSQLVALTRPDSPSYHPPLAMSSTLKPSSDSKRSHPPHQTKIPEQYRTQVQYLQDVFPTWTINGPFFLTLDLTRPC